MVDRRDREVTALVRGLGAEVATWLLAARVPRAFNRVDVVVARVGSGVVPDRVEDVELRLRAEERGVRDPGAAQEVLGLAGDVPRVTAVRLTGQRVVHEEREVQGGVLAERVEHGRAGVRYQQHVRLVDLLEPADRGAVEHAAFGEDLVIEGLGRDREVLDGTRQVTEPDIDEFNLVVADELQDLIAVLEHQPSLNGVGTALAGTASAGIASAGTVLPGTVGLPPWAPQLAAALAATQSRPHGGSACGRNASEASCGQLPTRVPSVSHVLRLPAEKRLGCTEAQALQGLRNRPASRVAAGGEVPGLPAPGHFPAPGGTVGE